MPRYGHPLAALFDATRQQIDRGMTPAIMGGIDYANQRRQRAEAQAAQYAREKRAEDFARSERVARSNFELEQGRTDRAFRERLSKAEIAARSAQADLDRKARLQGDRIQAGASIFGQKEATRRQDREALSAQKGYLIQRAMEEGQMRQQSVDPKMIEDHIDRLYPNMADVPATMPRAAAQGSRFDVPGHLQLTREQASVKFLQKWGEDNDAPGTASTIYQLHSQGVTPSAEQMAELLRRFQAESGIADENEALDRLMTVFGY